MINKISKSSAVSAMLEDIKAVLAKHEMALLPGFDGMDVSSAYGETLAHLLYVTQDSCSFDMADDHADEFHELDTSLDGAKHDEILLACNNRQNG
jgi:hypothetical protein